MNDLNSLRIDASIHDNPWDHILHGCMKIAFYIQILMYYVNIVLTDRWIREAFYFSDPEEIYTQLIVILKDFPTSSCPY